MTRACLLSTLAGLTLVACAQAESECLSVNHCRLLGGVAACAAGYEWEDPDDKENLRCVESEEPACPAAQDCTERSCGPDPICGLSCGTCEQGTCNEEGQCEVQCNDQCSSPGATQCSGGRTRTCVAGSDGCLRWTSYSDCPWGECANGSTCAACTPDCAGRDCGPDPVCGVSCGACSQGTCNASGQCEAGCEDDCASGTHTACTCSAADPCSWRGDDYCDEQCTTIFPNDHFDDAADCGSTCSDACATGETQCSGGEIRSCVMDGDGCRVWGSWTHCSFGSCASSTSCESCGNECGAMDLQQCSGGEIRSCVMDGDGCLVWDEWSACASGSCATSTTCLSCANECATDESECSDGEIRSCVTDGDGCLTWSAWTSCSSGFCGSATVCGSCAHECSSGESECSSGAFRSCVTDSHGCRMWGSATACPEGFCANGTSCGSCVDECSTAGQSVCSGGMTWSCIADTNDCLAWSEPVACDTGACGDATSCLTTASAEVVVAGYYHSCALTAAGGVRCWGSNGSGQLGDGTTTDRLWPTQVVGLSSGVVAIGAGYLHTCAVTSSGGLKCWGYNGYGQLGDGTTTDRLVPTEVVGLSSGVVAIGAGYLHTCALTSAGGVKCWGENGSGQLGDNSTTSRYAPGNASGLSSGVTALAAGGYHACALTSAGGVTCWGHNVAGQLGDGTTSDRHVPTAVSSLASGVVALSTTSNHTCVVTSSGGVKCWGENTAGALGDGTTTNRLVPTNVTGLSSGIAEVAAGSDFTCVRTSSGAARCWGENGSGQVGDGTLTNKLAPANVVGLSSGVVGLAAGSAHACAVTSSGGVQCWGDNSDGRLGDGSTIHYHPAAVETAGLSSGVVAVTAGEWHTCALTSSGGVECWGHGYYGELGNGETANQMTPVGVAGLAAGVSAVAAGLIHTCAVTSSGVVKCWGDNYNGELGDGTTTDRLVPTDVVGMSSGVVAVAAGYDHTCAVTSSGGAKCWGDNSDGQLGDGSTTDRYAAGDVTGLSSGVVALAAGEEHTCALTSSGGVKCWGYNYNGAVGDGTGTRRLVPTDVIGLSSGVVSLAAGSDFSCAVTSSGGVKCWGHGWGRAPVDVTGLSAGVIEVAAGHGHACALTSSGRVECWGDNSSGQVGQGTVADAVAVAAGSYHTCALTSSGGVECWGNNNCGQLGQALRPVEVLGFE